MTDPKVGGYNWNGHLATVRQSLRAIAAKAQRIYETGDDRAAAIALEVVKAVWAVEEMEKIAGVKDEHDHD